MSAPAQTRPTTQSPKRTLGYLACATAGCLWSTGFFFGKVALRELSVSHMVLYRFLFATVAFLPLLRRPRFAPREWRNLLLAALLGVPILLLLQFWGLCLTTVSHAAMMVGAMPMFLALGATLFAHERLGALGWCALGVSSAGVALIVLSGNSRTSNGPSLPGDLLVLASMMIALVYLLLNKQLVRSHSPLVVTAWGMLSGTAMLAVWVLARQGPPPVRGITLPVWLSLAASGLLCTATTTLLWNWGMRHVPASRAGVFLNIEPALGSVLGVTLLGDSFGPSAWIGGSMIVAAAIVLTTTGHGEGDRPVLD